HDGLYAPSPHLGAILRHITTGRRRYRSRLLQVVTVWTEVEVPLSANMSETATPRKFSVEGEQGLEDDERTGTSPRWTGDRGDGEGDPTAVYGGVQTE